MYHFKTSNRMDWNSWN